MGKVEDAIFDAYRARVDPKRRAIVEETLAATEEMERKAESMRRANIAEIQRLLSEAKAEPVLNEAVVDALTRLLEETEGD